MTDDTETAAVYAIGDDLGHIKIGMSRDPMNRLRYLKTASSRKLTLLFSKRYPSRLHARTIESRAHGILEPHGVSGEWFAASLADVNAAIVKAEAMREEPKNKKEPSLTEFRAWVDEMKDSRRWSYRECSRQLGCGVNQIAIWSENGAPPYIGLACAALAFGLPAWRKIQP